MAQTIKLKRSATQGASPTTSQLELGEVAINTYDGKMYIKKNVGGTESIVEIGSGGGGGGSGLASSFTLYEYTATASQTTFSGSDSNSNTLAYDTGTPPKILVYLNGVLLDYTTDYTATTGTSIVLTSAAAASDLVQIAAYKSSVSTILDIDLSDNQKLLLGDDDDLQIYHDGSNSWISEGGTGSLIVAADNFYVRNAAGTESKIDAISNGAVNLYYDNSKKFETTNDGVTVTGDVEADEFIGDVRGAVLFKAQAGETLAKGDVVYISGISGNTTVVSKADADDANKMPAFGIAAAAASANNPVDVYTGGILSGIDTSSFSEGDELFVSTTAGVLTATPPTGESAALQKIGKVTRSASSGSIFIIGAGRSNATPNLNEGKLFVGNSSNQAVADDTVHVDIANSRVGIGTTSPSTNLHVSGSDATIRISGDNSMTFHQDSAWNSNMYFGAHYNGSNVVYGATNRGAFKISSYHDGDTSPQYIAFYGANSGTSGNTITWNSVGFAQDEDGNVGIGTTSPQRPLHIHKSAASQDVRIQLSDGTTTDAIDKGFNIIKNTDQNAYLWNYQNASMFFGTNNVERLVITSSGNFEFNNGNFTEVGTISSGAITSSASVIASGNSNSFGNTTITNLSATSVTTSGSITASGNSNSFGNITTTGYLRGPSTFTIDPATHGDNTGTVVIAGNLQVDGTTTTINSTTLTVDDKNITLASGSSNAAAANGAGITVDCGSGTDATLTYDGTNDEWDFNKNINVTGAVVSSANGGITTASGTTARFSVSETGGATTAMDARGSTGNIGTRSNHTLGFLVNDVQKATLTANGDFSVTNDIKVTTTNPRIDFDGGNSGALRFFSTSAAQERMRITSAGNVGIGTNSPSIQVDVENTVANSGGKLRLGTSDSSTSGVMGRLIFGNGNDIAQSIIEGLSDGATDASALVFKTEATGSSEAERMRIESDGDIRFGSSSNYAWVRPYESSTGNLIISSDNAATGTNGSAIKFRTRGSDKMIIEHSGNVGIGTDSPQQLLEIQGDTPGLRIHANNTNTSPNPKIELMRGTSSTFGGDAFTDWRIECQNDARFRISSHDTTYGENARFIIKHSDGNVGISTVSPDSKLTVNVGSQGDGIELQSNETSIAKLSRTTVGSTVVASLDGVTGRPIHIGGIVNEEVILANAGGNVGIGTTSPSAKLQIEEVGIDTTTTSTTATTQVAIDTMAAATFRSAKYTIQVTNSTDSTYHITEILLIHDGTTPQITEYGTIFTGSAEATFDADISSGNVRLLATPSTTDSMTFKVVRHCITV